MECLEVTVNGERYCVAARNAARSMSAAIVHSAIHEPAHATGLYVHGWSADFKTRLEWGGADRGLAAGDNVVSPLRCDDEGAERIRPERAGLGSALPEEEALQ